jgi:hypothetical protein
LWIQNVGKGSAALLVAVRPGNRSPDFDEFDIAERVSAEDQIEQARRDVSESCPRDADDGVEEQKPL